jgi:predicted neuraminidase
MGTPEQITDPDQHLLGRCAPIEHCGNFLIPLYDEVKRNNVIFKQQEDRFTKMSEYGKDCIQPTLWKHGGVIMSASRTFGYWQPQQLSDIPNNNSSLHVAQLGKKAYVVWNNTSGRARKNLTLGIIDSIDDMIVAKPLLPVSEVGSYPFLQASDNQLTLTFTSYERNIMQYVWSKAKLRELEARRNTIGHYA